MIFKIGNTDPGDYSNRVIAGSYNVQTNPIFKSWTDANELEHRTFIRTRIEGTFDMYFKTLAEYNAFTALIASTRAADYTVPCSVLSNTTDTLIEGDFYIEFAPVRNRNGSWEDYMERFTVTIKEA